ncbi:MAG TPA: hypothetical protein VHF06_28895 [Pseudonocardiaceae bacterium]|nr:hypothetical protein [Pseudonocardiaceae bacterium]
MTGSLPSNEPPEPNDAKDTDEAGVAGSVTDEWVEVYQPDGTPQEEEPLPPRATASRSGVTTVVLFVIALLLVIVGSVTPLFEASLRVSRSAAATIRSAPLLDADAWQMHVVDSPVLANTGRSIAMPVPIGYPLALAAVLLLAAVALWLRTGQDGRTARVARPVGLTAAVFLAGLVFALGMFELAWGGAGSSELFDGLITHIGLGYWMLCGAAVVAIAAVVFGYRVRPAPDQPEPAQWAPPPRPDERQVPPGQPPEWPVVAVIPADEKTNW